MNKVRLTYRFDEKGKRHRVPEGSTAEDKVIPLYEEEYKVIEEHRPSSRFTQDYGDWESPFDAETRRIEQLIRESGNQRQGGPQSRGTYSREERNTWTSSAHVDPSREDDRASIRPFEPEEEYYSTEPAITAASEWEEAETGYGRHGQREEYAGRPPIWEEPERERNGTRYVRRPRTPWLKILASIAGAVATGALLGFFVLSLFSGQPSAEKAASDQSLQTDAAGVNSGSISPQADFAAGEGKNDAAAQKPQAAVLIPAKSYTFLQTGSFTTSQAAESVRTSLQKKGISAVAENSDKVYVYAGIAVNKEAAQGLSRKLKQEKIDVFLKSIELPAIAKLKWTGKPETFTGYLSKTEKLVSMISGLALVHLEDDHPRPLDETTAQSLKAAYDSWSAAASSAADEASGEARAPLEKMKAAFQAAKASLDAYKKTPSAESMWQAQAGLMQAVLAEKELFKQAADR